MGVDNNVFGLKDFYYRNSALYLFDGWSLDSFIRKPEPKPISRRVRNTASTAPRILSVTAAHREALATAMRRLGWRRLVTTQTGYLGLVPAATKLGDVITVFAGCNAPLVLRPGGGGRFSVVGEAYVHWVTGQELHQRFEMGICTIDDICIR